jgi:hypothetical protein
MKTRVLFCIVAVMIFASVILQGQTSNDSIVKTNDTITKKQKKENPAVLKPYHRNVIRFNPTPMLVCSNVRNITLSYEHLVKPSQSFMIQVGYLNFPPIYFDSVVGLISFERETDIGLNAAFDYRFYLFKRNRRPAPDGLYIGPYVSYYGFKYTNLFTTLRTDTVRTATQRSKYSLFNLGIVVGYQFIFWKRLSIDLVLCGPSLTYFISKKEITGDIDQKIINEINDETKAKFEEEFPIISQILTLSGESSSAYFHTFFRYSISIGYHFK